MKNLLLFFLAICLHIILHAQVTNGLVAYYPLNGNENDSSGNGNNGSAGGITSSTDRYGFSNAAAYFDGTSASVEVPRSIEDNFTVSFWFKTTQVTSTGAVQWYQGKGLVDAEICGVTNDWGITLINGGKVCVGIGNPDITLFSPNDYNDGNWHHVAVRRNMATSFVELFIDSVLVASGNTINTQSLNTASGIRFGNDYCAPFSSLFNGEMDDVKFYNRLLSDSEIDTLASLLPFAAVHDKRVYEGNGTTVMDVKISLSHAYNEQVKINYRTADSTAIAPADYTATSGTIRFGVGRTQKHISITLNGNTTPENAKYFKVILSDPVNALLADSISVEKIKDDDTTVVPGKTNALQNISIAKSKITIAPNPAKDIIYISGSPDKNSVILVSDINGKTFIKQKAIEGRNSINISGIAPGNYFIQLIVEGKIQTFQFVKM